MITKRQEMMLELRGGGRLEKKRRGIGGVRWQIKEPPQGQNGSEMTKTQHPSQITQEGGRYTRTATGGEGREAGVSLAGPVGSQ